MCLATASYEACRSCNTELTFPTLVFLEQQRESEPKRERERARLNGAVESFCHFPDMVQVGFQSGPYAFVFCRAMWHLQPFDLRSAVRSRIIRSPIQCRCSQCAYKRENGSHTDIRREAAHTEVPSSHVGCKGSQNCLALLLWNTNGK